MKENNRFARKTVIKPAISSDFLRYWRVKSTGACCGFHSWSCRLIMLDNDQPISLCPRHQATRRARKNQPAHRRDALTISFHEKTIADRRQCTGRVSANFAKIIASGRVVGQVDRATMVFRALSQSTGQLLPRVAIDSDFCAEARDIAWKKTIRRRLGHLGDERERVSFCESCWQPSTRCNFDSFVFYGMGSLWYEIERRRNEIEQRVANKL